MEMYADEDSRGGILESEGIVNIKFRRDKQLATMARLDAQYGDLKRQLTDKSLSHDQLSDIKVKMTAREELLLPVYTQVALQFADLHDTAGRMEAKGTIRHPLQWKNARRFFYWRLRRRLNEESVLKKMANAHSKSHHNSLAHAALSSVGTPSISTREARLETLRAWTGFTDGMFEKDDRGVAVWYEEHRKEVNGKVDGMRTDGVSFDVASLLRGNKEGGLKGVKQVLEMLPAEERESVIAYLVGKK